MLESISMRVAVMGWAIRDVVGAVGLAHAATRAIADVIANRRLAGEIISSSGREGLYR